MEVRVVLRLPGEPPNYEEGGVASSPPHREFFEKIMDLSLLIFTLETYRFCMKCIDFTTRTYSFKTLYEEMLRSDENKKVFSS